MLLKMFLTTVIKLFLELFLAKLYQVFLPVLRIMSSTQINN